MFCWILGAIECENWLGAICNSWARFIRDFISELAMWCCNFMFWACVLGYWGWICWSELNEIASLELHCTHIIFPLCQVKWLWGFSNGLSSTFEWNFIGMLTCVSLIKKVMFSSYLTKTLIAPIWVFLWDVFKIEFIHFCLGWVHKRPNQSTSNPYWVTLSTDRSQSSKNIAQNTICKFTR